MSYFLIKLLQHFSSFELQPNAGPPHSRPPKEWSNASGRKGIDQLRPKSHLTLYTEVIYSFIVLCLPIDSLSKGGLWITATEAAGYE
jgi:hypothetical protein